jgi:hypothetical protein
VLDVSHAPPRKLDGQAYTVLVPQVDSDGNEIGGIRLPNLAAPAGTYTGWSLLRSGMGGPDLCAQNGQFVPFANTVAERVESGDPRLSIEERYPDPADFVGRIVDGAARCVSIDALSMNRFAAGAIVEETNVI